MSSVDLFGVPLKLSRIFLKICKWILLKMSLNCKVVGSNSKLPANFKLKKANEPQHEFSYSYLWKALLFSVILVGLVGLVWFLFCPNDGGFKTKTEITDYCDRKSGVLHEHFNVSKEEFEALTSSFYESDQVLFLFVSSSILFFVAKFQVYFLILRMWKKNYLLNICWIMKHNFTDLLIQVQI